MSNNEFYDFNQISDSAIIYNNKPNKVILILVYLIISIFVVFLIWASFAKKDEYVKVYGEVRPESESSIILSPSSAIVKDIYIKNGEYVNKGDLLLELDTTAANNKYELLETEMKKAENKISNYNKLKIALVNGNNIFDQNDENQKDFFDLFQQYSNQINTVTATKENHDLENQKEDLNYDSTLKQNEDKRNQVQTDLDTLSQYIESIKNNNDIFKEEQKESNYYQDYLNYLAQYNIYEKKIETLSNDINQESEFENLQSEFELWKSQKIVDLASEKRKLESELEGINFNIDITKKSKELLQAASSNYNIEKQSVLFSAFNQINSQINIINDSKLQLNLQIIDLKDLINNSEVKANKSGKIMLNDTVTIGSYLTTNSEILRIVPQEDNLQFTLSVPENHIASFKIGNEIEYQINSLPYTEYGKANGIVKEIYADSYKDSTTGQSYFIVKGTIEQSALTNKKGETISLISGMKGSAVIIKEPRTVLEWILDELNLLINS